MTVFELLEGELMDKQDTDRLIDTIRTSCYKIEEAEFLKILGKQKLFEDLKLEWRIGLWAADHMNHQLPHPFPYLLYIPSYSLWPIHIIEF